MKKVTLFLMALLVSVASMAQSTSCSTVAEVKALTGENVSVKFTSSSAIITFALTDGIIIEDATGAMMAQSYDWRYETAVKPGMKISSLSAYWNYKNTIDYGNGYTQEENYPGVLYTPDSESLTYTLGEASTVTYQTATAAQLIADYAGYKYRAVKIAKTAISQVNGSYVIAAGDTTLALYYSGNLPGEATLYGYYGPHPYGESRGTVFNVVNAEIDLTVLNNANIISEYSAEDYGEVQYVMVGEEKMRISYDGDNELPKVATTLKGYKANESYYEYDDNYNAIEKTREVFVVSEFTYETVTIADFVATTEKVGYSSYKCVTYNGEKVFLTAPYSVTIPGMGTVTGYFIEKASSSGVSTFFWVLTAEATGYSNINEYKTAVGAGKTAEKAAALAEGMLISYVYTEGENTTLFVTQKSGYSTYYSAIRTTATDKNGKAYAAGDSIKGVKGILSVFGFDNTTQQFTSSNHLDVEAGNIEIISTGHTANIPAASSLYGIQYLTGSSKRSAGSYDMKYSTIPVGQIKAVGSDYYFFSDAGDSILIVTPGFTPAAYLSERVGLKAYVDVMNSGDKVQLIVPTRADIITSNVKFQSVADMIAAGQPATGITYELESPVLLTYIQQSSQTDWNTMEEIPQYYLYVQDATGAVRIQLDTAATRVCKLAVGDSIVGFKGVYSQYNGFGITGTDITYTVKNSNNPLVPKVITIKEYLETQAAATYSGMLVRFEGVEFVERDTTVYTVTRKDRDFIQGDYKITYSKSNFEDNLSHFTFYPVNNITAIADKSWMTSQYGFMPINQAAIENAVSQEEGATIISIRNNTTSKPVKFTGSATTTFQTARGVIVQDGTGAILLDGVDTLALDRSITNIEGTYYPSSDECMARIVPTTLEDKGRGRLSKESVTIDSLVHNIANFEGEIVDIEVAKTTRVAEGVYYMLTTDSVQLAVVGSVVPSDAKITGLVYHLNAADAKAFTVTSYDFYKTGSNRVLMFHELKDYMGQWASYEGESYAVSGFTSPVLVNAVYDSEGGTALNVQQTNTDGSITSLTVWAMYTPDGVTFQPGDSISFVKGGYSSYSDLSSLYGAAGYAEGRCVSAYRYDYHIGDIDYPTDVDSIEVDGEMQLPAIVEVQLGKLINQLSTGNALTYTEVSDITGFFGANSVQYQGQNFKVKGTIVVDTTTTEWDGEVNVNYTQYIKVGETKILLGGVDLKVFANQEVTLKANFDIGFAEEDQVSLQVLSVKDVDAGIALAANIAEFISMANTAEEVMILSELAVTYQNGANIYVKDNSGSLLIYDFDYQNAGYVNGDRLTGVKGKFKSYNGLPEMVEATLPAAVAGAAVAPRAISIADLATAELSEYVVLNEVRFSEDLAFTETSRNATVDNGLMEVAIYNQYKLTASWGTQTPVAIVGTVGIYNDEKQLNYISHDIFAVDFADIAAIYAKGKWEDSRHADYSYQSVYVRLNSRPTVVDKYVTSENNMYYLNDGTGVIVLNAPVTGENWMGEIEEGLEIEVGQKLPAGMLAHLDFLSIFDEETWLPTDEVYGAPILSFAQKVTGVDEEGWDTYESCADFVAGCEESDFVEEVVEVKLADVLADRLAYAGKLLAIDTTANYYAEAAMDYLTGETNTIAYMFEGEVEDVFEVYSYEEEGVTTVMLFPLMTEDEYNYAGTLFNLQAENLPEVAFDANATINVTTARFDWNNIAIGQTLILKESWKVIDPTNEVAVEDNFSLNANVYSNNGVVYVEAEAGAMIEVYTVNGIRIYAGVSNTETTIINGINTNAAIIRVNGEAYKVFVK